MELIEIIKAIKDSEGKIFRVEFIRRTDSKDGKQKAGDIRTMVCRLGVSKGVNGKGLAFDPAKKALMPVFDMQKQSWRMINLATVVSLKVAGKEVNVS